MRLRLFWVSRSQLLRCSRSRPSASFFGGTEVYSEKERRSCRLSEPPEYTKRLRAVWQARNEQASRKLAAKVIQYLGATCLTDDLNRCLAFYQFPEAHWSHLLTTNVIESPFASVRLRTNAAKRFTKNQERRVPVTPGIAATPEELAAAQVSPPVFHGSVAEDEERRTSRVIRTSMPLVNSHRI